MKIVALIVTLLLPLAGCALPPVQADGVIAYWCATNTPTEPTRAQYATFSDRQKRDMDVHNTWGAKHCGWKPGR
jgi:hypothetical protein